MEQIHSFNRGLLRHLKMYKQHFFELNAVFFCVVLSIGLPTSEALMSIGTIGLVINWLVEKQFLKKWETVKTRNYLPLLLIGSFLVLLLGLINTTNFDYAIHDLKIKLPLLFLPLVIGSIVIKQKHVKLIFSFFLAAVAFSTFISYFVYLEVIPIEKTLNDVRNISIFISHIRLSLLICMAIVLLAFYSVRTTTFFLKLSALLLIVWFIYFLTILQAITGIVILLMLAITLVGKVFLKKSNAFFKLFIIGVIFSFGFYAYWNVNTIYKNNFIAKSVDVLALDEKTEGGEIYQHKLEEDWVENGNRVWHYIAPIELNEAWNKRSSMKLDSLDLVGQPLWGTLYRFLASKGLRKDKKGVEYLTDLEIKDVENGKTNCCENLSGLNLRIKQTLFEFIAFRKGQNPNGHSIIQRVIYLKTSFQIVKENLLLGVGLGDVNDAFMQKYEEENSTLKGSNRKRVHNQFLSILVALGVFGFSFWLFALLFPSFYSANKSSIYVYFLIIVFFSFITDNTLERQAGVMFFSFFNSIFLFQSTKN